MVLTISADETCQTRSGADLHSRRGQFDQHGHIHARHNLDVRPRLGHLHTCIAGRISEHVGENDRTRAPINGRHRLSQRMANLVRVRITPVPSVQNQIRFTEGAARPPMCNNKQ